jgi:hypothetical protein
MRTGMTLTPALILASSAFTNHSVLTRAIITTTTSDNRLYELAALPKKIQGEVILDTVRFS